MFSVRVSILLGVLIFPAIGLADDDDVRKIFDQLYAAKIKQVGQTPGSTDDVELARELLTAAHRSVSTPTGNDGSTVHAAPV